jgi:hypothetical protein
MLLRNGRVVSSTFPFLRHQNQDDDYIFSEKIRTFRQLLKTVGTEYDREAVLCALFDYLSKSKKRNLFRVTKQTREGILQRTKTKAGKTKALELFSLKK